MQGDSAQIQMKSKQNNKLIVFSLVILLAVSLSLMYVGLNKGKTGKAYETASNCGNNVCEIEETVESCPADCIQLDLYVSLEGNDYNSGSIEQPFRTIEKARDKIRELKSSDSLNGPVNVYLREGKYELEQTFVLDSSDSGALNMPITYSAYPNEKVVVSGGRSINLSWEQYANNTYYADVSEFVQNNGHFNSLFVDNARAARAKSPNNGYYKISKVDKETNATAFNFSGNDIRADWRNLNDVEIVALRAWTQSRMKIVSVEGQKVFFETKVKPVLNAGYESWLSGRYYVENVFEGLDSEGEWYLDKQENKLYYFTDGNISSKEFTIPALTTVIVVNSTGEQITGHISFKGLNVQHTDWVFPPGGYPGVTAEGYEKYTTAAVIFVKGMHLSFDSGSISRAGDIGIQFWYVNSSMLNATHIYDAGNSGVRGRHDANSMKIINNKVQDTGILFKESGGIQFGMSANNTISNNEVFNSPYIGISYGGRLDSCPTDVEGVVISFNDVHDVMQELNDGGAFYLMGRENGTLLENNFVHDVKITEKHRSGTHIFGIYLDEGGTNMILRNNIVKDSNDAALVLHQAFYNVIINNMFLNSHNNSLRFAGGTSRDPCLNIVPEGNNFTKNIVYFLNSTSEIFKVMSNSPNNSIERSEYNIYYHPGYQTLPPEKWNLDWWRAKGFDIASLVEDPLFEDYENNNFALLPESSALKPESEGGIGFNQISLESVGPQGIECFEDLECSSGFECIQTKCVELNFCGDNLCKGDETCSSCPGDCGVCGPVCNNDGFCGEGETVENCLNDCKFCDYAVKPDYKLSGLNYGDILFTYRIERKNPSFEEAISNARAFNATQFVWVHTTNSSLIAEAKQFVSGFQCAGRAEIKIPGAMCISIDGSPVISPNFRSFPPFNGYAIGDVNTLAYRDFWVNRFKSQWDAGCTFMHQDNSRFNEKAAFSWGGCFSPESVIGFSEYLRNKYNSSQLERLGIADINSFNFRELLVNQGAPSGDALSVWLKQNSPLASDWFNFSRDSTIKFYQDIKLIMDDYASERAGKSIKVPLSLNILFSHLSETSSVSLYWDVADYIQSELYPNSQGLNVLFKSINYSRSHNTLQAFVYVPAVVGLANYSDYDFSQDRSDLSAIYALGALPVVPWDVYITPENRYFGKVADYADLYSFVRENNNFFDNYEFAGMYYTGLNNKTISNVVYDVAKKRTVVETNKGSGFVPLGLKVKLNNGTILVVDQSISNVGYLYFKGDKTSFFNVGDFVLIENEVNSDDYYTRLREGVFSGISSSKEDILMAVRAVPRNKDAPVVIHLVDMKNSQQPFSIKLNPELFFNKPARYSLLRQGMAELPLIPIVEGKNVSLNVPALTPWGIVIVKMVEECGNSVCEQDENCSSCPGDCGSCSSCGNGVCDGSESCSSCSGDCGSCNGGSSGGGGSGGGKVYYTPNPKVEEKSSPVKKIEEKEPVEQIPVQPVEPVVVKPKRSPVCGDGICEENDCSADCVEKCGPDGCEEPINLVLVISASIVTLCAILFLVFAFVKPKDNRQKETALKNYIILNLNKGHSKEKIRSVLVSAGWNPKLVDSVMTEVVPPSVPLPTPYASQSTSHSQQPTSTFQRFK